MCMYTFFRENEMSTVREIKTDKEPDWNNKSEVADKAGKSMSLFSAEVMRAKRETI